MAFSCALVLRKVIFGGNLGPMKRIRPEAAGLIASGCTAIGAVVGTLSPRADLLLAGWVIEGIGMGVIAVAAPVVVGMKMTNLGSLAALD